MKFLMVYPNQLGAVQEQLGISYLVAQLEREGVEVGFWDGTFYEKDSFVQNVKEWKPNYVGISVRSNDYREGLKYASTAKHINSEIKVVVGGVHATLRSEDVWKDYVDAIIRGEADESLVEYVKGNENAPGIVTDSLEVKKPKIPDVNSLALPNHGIWSIRHFEKEFYGKKGRIGMFLTSRGCPFDCSECCNAQLRRVHKGRWTRLRSVRSVEEEIWLSKEEFEIDHFYVADDTFTFNRDHVMRLCDKFRGIRLPWHCMARCDTVDLEMFETMKEAGCETVLMGIESGSRKIREGVLNRKMSNDEIIEAFQAAKKVGIKTVAFNMVGFPGETEEDFLDTVRLNLACEVEDAKMTILTALPGTRLWYECKKEGWLKEEFPLNYYEDTNIGLPGVSVKELRRRQNFFYKTIRGA